MECITSSIKASSDFSWCFLAQILDTLLIRITITVCLTVICKSISRIGTFFQIWIRGELHFMDRWKIMDTYGFQSKFHHPTGLLLWIYHHLLHHLEKNRKYWYWTWYRYNQRFNFLNIRIVPFRFSCYHFAYLCFQLHLELW